MSETASIDLQIKDEAAARAAAAELGLPALERGVADLFSTYQHSGLILKLPGWRYPVILDTAGKAHFDTYHGKWGNEAELKRFQQHYGFHAAKALALRQGHTVTRKVKADGTLQLVVNV